eukprot:scaffold2534_cov260-Pinguiococcus_pyrenoidosus.AAC.28
MTFLKERLGAGHEPAALPEANVVRCVVVDAVWRPSRVWFLEQDDNGPANEAHTRADDLRGTKESPQT